MSFDLRDLVFGAAIAWAATITLGVVSLEREIRLAGDGAATLAANGEPKPVRLEPVVVTAHHPGPAIALVRDDKTIR